MICGDPGDASREVDVLLGHPSADVLGALAVAVDGVLADELEVDVPVADRDSRVVADRRDFTVPSGMPSSSAMTAIERPP